MTDDFKIDHPPNYVDRIVIQLAEQLDDCDDDLLRLYALLALTLGDLVTEKDVHDAWCVWKTVSKPDHPALIPFDELSVEAQALDTPYADAIRTVAKAMQGDKP
jgi:hypothetical protein